MKWQWLYVVWALLVGCVTTRGVRLETDDGRTLVVTSGVEAAPVDLEEDAFAEALVAESGRARPSRSPERAARRLFEMDERGGVYRFDVRTQQVTPLGAGGHLEGDGADAEMTRAYLRWCERTGQSGDCLRLLVGRSTVDGDGRYALALALAHGAVLEEMWEAFEDMADPRAMVAAAMWTGTLYLVLWSVPEPLSKGLAAVMTATLIAYVGVDTFWSLVAGFQRLMEAVDKAHTFDELREAGESYGRVMGRNAARAFAMLATVAIGNTAAGFAGRVPTLPGSAQASVQASAKAGIALSAVGEVRAVAVAGEVMTLAVSTGAVSAMAQGGGAVGPVDSAGHDHHIATDKWWVSDKNGGPWSPLFQKLFDKAGMSLNDRANIVRVNGHKGPHPQAYHQRVLNRLTEALEDCGTLVQCREALTTELRRLAKQVSTPGSELNKLVTRT